MNPTPTTFAAPGECPDCGRPAEFCGCRPVTAMEVLRDMGYCCCRKDDGWPILATDCPKHGNTLANRTDTTAAASR